MSPGLELAFIFRGNELKHLGLGPQSLGFLTLGNFPGGGLSFLFKVLGKQGRGEVLRPCSPVMACCMRSLEL